MKKLLAIILAIIMIAACFAGCAGDGKDSSKPDSSKADSSKPDKKDSAPDDGELKVSMDGSLPLVPERVSDMTMTLLVGPTDDDPNDMWFFKYYADITNVEWQITPVLQADWGEKKAVIMGSGDYTDVFWSRSLFTTGEMLTNGTHGVFLDLSKYYDYAPDYVKAMDLVEGSWNYVTTPDGANYSLAYVNPANYYANNSAELWLRTQLLNDAGYDFSDKDYIMTLDELYNVLKDLKETGLVPLTGRIDNGSSGLRIAMLNAFGFVTDGNSIGFIDDKVVFIPTTDRYREYLVYMNKLYSEGLLDQDFYSQDETQLKAKTSEGGAAGWIYSVPFLMDLERNMEYTCYAIAYDSNSDPVKNIGSSVRYGSFEITDRCTRPELAIAWANLFYQPKHAFNIMYGPTMTKNQETGEYTMISEGVADYDKGFEVAAPAILDKDGNYAGIDTTVYYEKYADEYTLWDWYAKNKPVNGAYDISLGEGYIFGQIWQGYPSNAEETQVQNKGRIESGNEGDENEGWWRYNNLMVDAKWAKPGYPTVYFTAEQQEWLDANATILNDYVYQMEAKFITGAASIDAEYDNFIAELKKMGAEDYQKLYVEVYPG